MIYWTFAYQLFQTFLFFYLSYFYIFFVVLLDVDGIKYLASLIDFLNAIVNSIAIFCQPLFQTRCHFQIVLTLRTCLIKCCASFAKMVVVVHDDCCWESHRIYHRQEVIIRIESFPYIRPTNLRGKWLKQYNNNLILIKS